jgi:hypothetical protein
MLSQSSYSIRKYCPLHENPCDNCYCASLNSQDIEKAIYYCTSNFNACPIYNTGDRRIEIDHLPIKLIL